MKRKNNYKTFALLPNFRLQFNGRVYDVSWLKAIGYVLAAGATALFLWLGFIAMHLMAVTY